MHVVWSKHVRPSGHSLESPDGHASSQVALALLKLVPQKYELLSSQVVKAKQEVPIGHSDDWPVGHGSVQEAEASSRVAPQ